MSNYTKLVGTTKTGKVKKLTTCFVRNPHLKPIPYYKITVIGSFEISHSDISLALEHYNNL